LIAGKLTKSGPKGVENLGPGGHSDGNGLFLVVGLTSRSWLWRGQIKNRQNTAGSPKRVELSLGNYRFVTLQRARLTAQEYP
jgi:hypothetical protein